ncbi:unnamed protein product [Brachionus calyciflorus]|uniref:Kinesin-like protein n=1 Tax=Brachionus calyciflorus TaxID=104777 RepID=A0A813USL1_9BILA|nr:unnamed protein product [Brachionus calyciflorus]
MVKQTIQIFCRIKPTKGKKSLYEIDPKDSGDIVTFNVPKDVSEGFINNKKEEYKFKFERVFNQDTLQDDIFKEVAEPVIENVLSGYNGTIFAYGQTGSGKTFTITGGPEKYTDRGIIPRSISYIFEMFAKKPEYSFTMHISYLEIYNENGYDLLDPQHQASKLEDLPKVSLMEDEDNNIHLKNLSIHQANNEEEALNLLFLGDTNRMIAETPMNQASTRSHCIFTLHLTARETGSATIRKAKLHLVDLAGSERIGKTNANGILLTEAKYINLSLHYLEQVIVALAEKNRTHVPYRNSMMTSVLRDSLGGNCMTTMIATCSAEKRNLDESISTCRFAQRVAMIKNEAIINEELDPKLIINRLKREVEELKNQLSIANNGDKITGDLTLDEIEKLKILTQRYLEDRDDDSTLNVGADMRKINFCFKLIKEMYTVLLTKGKSNSAFNSNNNNNVPANITIVDASHYDTKELKDLKDTLKQRDNEISILVNMLKKEKKKIADGVNGKPQIYSLNSGDSSNDDLPKELLNKNHHTKRQILQNMSVGRQEAFEIFKRDYSGNEEIEEQKKFLKKSYTEAKMLGELINSARNKLNHLKTKSEQIYAKLEATNSLNDTRQNVEYESIRKTMEFEKENYRQNFEKLKNLKTQIEHAQYLIEKSQVKLQKDFENWWTEQCELNEQKQQKLQGLDRNDSISTIPSTANSLSTSSRINSSVNNSTLNQSYQSEKFSANDYGEGYRKLPEIDSKNSNSKINLTGDSEIDADITAFINARKRIINQMKPKN